VVGLVQLSSMFSLVDGLRNLLGIPTASAAQLPPLKDNTDKLAAQIATLEGYKKTGTLADRQRNPGNLRYVGQKNAVKGDRGFARFNTHQDGWKALRNQISLDASRGHTLQSFIYKYAPPSENNTASYLGSVSKVLRAKPSTKLSVVIK